MLEYSKTIGNLLGNPDPPVFMIEDPKKILKVSISMCHAVLCSIFLLLVIWINSYMI